MALARSCHRFDCTNMWGSASGHATVVKFSLKGSSVRDPCAYDPCMKRGHCILLSNNHNYVCKCYPRYSGPNCQIDNGPPCDRHPCLNGGNCVEDAMGSYQCYCPAGWAGKNCDVKIENGPCDSSNQPCKNDATCVRIGNDYKCHCLPGWEGKDCEINKDDCFEHPCRNGGKCSDGIDGYSCDCDRTGPCQNGGTCHEGVNGVYCNCTSDFTGALCEEPMNACGGLCQNNSVCVASNDGRDYHCECLP
ncbi:unnamed protein product, partial [Nesidiocoris tenuis]